MNLKETIRHLLPERMKVHRIRSGTLAGCWIYTSWHDYPGAIRGNTETSLLDWFAKNVKAGETWLDVGAHYGYTGIALSRLVGPGGRVVAFEPVLATAGCIARTREANNLTRLQIVPMGLSSEPCIVPRLLPVYRGMADPNLAKTGWHEQVYLAGFDKLWESLSGDDPVIHGVKIDVQGMESSVLGGMTEALRRWHPKLVIEFHRGVDRSAIFQLLKTCGYNSQPEPMDGPSGLIEDDKSYAFV